MQPFSNQAATTADKEALAIKAAPHSIEAEQSVLGGIMLNNEVLETFKGDLIAQDFYLPQHKQIYSAILILDERQSPIDPLILSAELKNLNQLQAVGGDAYLLELARNTPSASNVKAYADLVKERSIRRKLIQISRKIADSAYNPEGRSAEELLNEAERRVFALGEERPKQGGPKIIGDVTGELLTKISELELNPGGITGLTTGFAKLDEMTSGLQKSDLVVVAGRPSMGKTTFAMNLVESAIMNSDLAAVVFSMEMPADQLAMRMLSSLGRINQTNLRTGQLTDPDWDRITSAITLIKDKPLYIDETPGLSPNDIRARTRRIARQEKGISIIMVDYLQLMRGSGNPENRTNEISEISRSLKAIAKEFNCPVVALSQLNRSLEQRTIKRPIMSDLRESGAIEQDADVIAFVYRDEVYNPEEQNNKGLAEIIIGKQRNGPIGTVPLLFTGQYTRFDNLAAENYSQYREAGYLEDE